MSRWPRRVAHLAPVAALTLLSACGKEATPTAPTAQTSFLSGTWRGTATIQVNPGDPGAPPPSTGPMTWTFEPVPQTNLRTFRVTIQSTHRWLTMETTLDGPDTGQHAACPNQHPGGVPVTSRVSRDVRELRDRERDTDRGQLHRDGLRVGDVQRDGRTDEGVSVRRMEERNVEAPSARPRAGR